jgi:hypothetical protein
MNTKFMKKYTLFFIISALIIGLIGGYLLFKETPIQTQVQTNEQTRPNRGSCLADDCLAVEDLEYPADTLPDTVKNALDEAITDEYKALATYEAVIAKLGSVRPFSMIKGAEEQHIASLKALYDKYGLQPPVNVWLNKVSVPSTLQESCQAGVNAEIANAALYKDSLLPSVSTYEDIVQVFTNLMNASEQKHLKAFERCN